MRKTFLLGLTILGLAIWIGLCFLVISDAVPANYQVVNYQITRFQFGPHTYELSEPTIDWTNFRGRVTEVMRLDTFFLYVFEGSDAAGDNWVVMPFIVDLRGNRKEPVILCVSINENVTGEVSKMKSTNFYHQGYIETGKEDYRLRTMNPPPDFKKYIEGRIEKGKKHAI